MISFETQLRREYEQERKIMREKLLYCRENLTIRNLLGLAEIYGSVYTVANMLECLFNDGTKTVCLQDYRKTEINPLLEKLEKGGGK